MNAARAMVVQRLNEIHCLDCEALVSGNARPQARHIARRAGWIEAGKVSTRHGKLDMWRCPECAQKRKTVFEGRHKTITVYDGEAKDKAIKAAADFAEAAAIYDKKRKTPFEIGFSRILTDEQMAACSRLLAAIERQVIGGNACQSYDGIGVDSFNAHEKVITDACMSAYDFEKACQLAIVAEVQTIHHDAWRVFRHAVEQQINVQDLGKWINRLRGDRMGEKKQRRTAVSIVERCAEAIREIRY